MNEYRLPDQSIYARLAAATFDATYDACRKVTSAEAAVIRTGIAVVDAVLDLNRDDRNR